MTMLRIGVFCRSIDLVPVVVDTLKGQFRVTISNPISLDVFVAIKVCVDPKSTNA